MSPGDAAVEFVSEAASGVVVHPADINACKRHRVPGRVAPGRVGFLGRESMPRRAKTVNPNSQCRFIPRLLPPVSARTSARDGQVRHGFDDGIHWRLRGAAKVCEAGLLEHVALLSGGQSQHS